MKIIQRKPTVTHFGGTTPANDASNTIEQKAPYTAEATITGTTPLLFHRWSCEDVEEKADAIKGSIVKKTDNIESYIYRDTKGWLCLPGEYIRQSIIAAAKFKQDPRSHRKSAVDLIKAGVHVVTELCSLGLKQWDYEDRRRVCIKMASITRVRPAFHTDWTCKVCFLIVLPEYIDKHLLNELLVNAGRLIGVGNFRPTYGRFAVTSFRVLSENDTA